VTPVAAVQVDNRRQVVIRNPISTRGPLSERLAQAQTILLRQAPVTPYAPEWHAITDADLPLIEARCRLKAEGARWAEKRRRMLKDGAVFSTEIEPLDRDIIARAKELPDCFLWMCHPTGPSPSDLRLYEVVAGAFEVVADVLSILKAVLDEPGILQNEFEGCLDLLAEAQSSLRSAIQNIDGPRDADQLQVFDWLRTTARTVVQHRSNRNESRKHAGTSQKAAQTLGKDSTHRLAAHRPVDARCGELENCGSNCTGIGQ
jgi:hypothetical protein